MSELRISYPEFFVPGKGQRVRVASDHGSARVALIVSKIGDQVPLSVLTRCARPNGILNFAGATSMRDAAERQRLFWYMQSVFGGRSDMPFRASDFCAMSGGTRVLEEGLSQGNPTGRMTIVEVPGLIYHLNPSVRTAGHAPRTAETLGYEGDHSSFSISDEADSKTIANPDIHLLWLLQKSASDVSGWDGDLESYLELMQLVQDADMGTAAQFFWSGGGVTAKELWGSVVRRFPVLLPRGSGRIVDSVIHALDGDLGKIGDDREHIEQMWADPLFIANLDVITVVDSTKPRQAQRWLEEHGFAA